MSKSVSDPATYYFHDKKIICCNNQIYGVAPSESPRYRYPITVEERNKILNSGFSKLIADYEIEIIQDQFYASLSKNIDQKRIANGVQLDNKTDDVLLVKSSEHVQFPVLFHKRRFARRSLPAYMFDVVDNSDEFKSTNRDLIESLKSDVICLSYDLNTYDLGDVWSFYKHLCKKFQIHPTIIVMRAQVEIILKTWSSEQGDVRTLTPVKPTPTKQSSPKLPKPPASTTDLTEFLEKHTSKIPKYNSKNLHKYNHGMGYNMGHVAARLAKTQQFIDDYLMNTNTRSRFHFLKELIGRLPTMNSTNLVEVRCNVDKCASATVFEELPVVVTDSNQTDYRLHMICAKHKTLCCSCGKLYECGVDVQRDRLYQHSPLSLQNMDAHTFALIVSTTRLCKYCGLLFEKSGGCNRVTCKCGKELDWSDRKVCIRSCSLC